MEAIQFALLGLATGAVYALVALGLVLIYRGSGLLNFAQGAMAMFGAYAYYELTVKIGMGRWLALFLALVLCAVLGALIHLVVLREMRRRNASPLARVIATLSILLILQSAAFLIYGIYPLHVPGLLPTSTVELFGGEVSLTADRLYIIAICLVLSAVLFVVYRRTSFGRVTTAVAENELAASSLGYSPDTVAAVNWAVGSALAGLAGILIAPILLLQPTALVLLIIPGLAAGLLGGFVSFPVVLAASLGLGLVQSEISRYVHGVGWSTAVPFLVVIAFLVVRGRALPLRGFVLDRPPLVGTGRLRPPVLVAIWALGTLVAFAAGAQWDTAMITSFGFGIIGLSVVLLTGYGGQLSLAQFVIAGVGAMLAAKLIVHVPLIPAVLIACLATGAVGAIIGLPALRTRGATLAVATLCLGSAVIAVVFSNSAWTGGLTGLEVPSLSLFGWSIDPVGHPDRYAFVTFTVMLAIAIAIANLRRGMTGRQLLAVRSNERAAAALGVPVAGMKVFAFFVSAAIAAVGGIFLAFVQPSVQMSSFDIFTSILIVGLTVIAGIGFVPGGALAGMLIAGGIFQQILSGWSSAGEYLPLIGAVGLLLTLMTSPDGSFAVAVAAGRRAIGTLDRLESHLWGRFRRPRPTTPVEALRVAPQTLRVEGISVSFGGVRAVDDVSIEVRPGEVHGVIGPNGAGKTTLIDAITGFARPGDGSVRLGEDDVTRWSPRRRADHGLSRSFQSLELFDDLTVEENLAVACERHRPWRGLVDLVRPGRVALSPAAQAAVQRFQLTDVLAVQPTSISFGQRKIVAIARAVAGSPSTLLLDEPAAGLGDLEADELATLIRQLAEEWGIGVLLVEHKVDLIMATCDRITVMDSGRLLASGTPSEIQSHPEVLDAYLGAVAA